MGYDAEGTIYIPAEEFWAFVSKYLPNELGGETLFGPPMITKDGVDLVVDYSLSTECHPSDWSKESKVATKWREYKTTGVLKSPE